MVYYKAPNLVCQIYHLNCANINQAQDVKKRLLTNNGMSTGANKSFFFNDLGTHINSPSRGISASPTG